LLKSLAAGIRYRLACPAGRFVAGDRALDRCAGAQTARRETSYDRAGTANSAAAVSSLLVSPGGQLFRQELFLSSYGALGLGRLAVLQAVSAWLRREGEPGRLQLYG